jgi:hypothetical protein
MRSARKRAAETATLQSALSSSWLASANKFNHPALPARC